MTKEKLEKEARFRTKGWKEQENCVQAYLAGAEPREKRIAKLEKACDETQELLDKQIEATYKLDKENSELKARVEKQDADILFLKHLTESLRSQIKALEGQTPWKDIKDKSEVIGKLSKAKELLREIIDTPVFNQMGGVLYENEGYSELVKEAEQFLSSSENPNKRGGKMTVRAECEKCGHKWYLEMKPMETITCPNCKTVYNALIVVNDPENEKTMRIVRERSEVEKMTEEEMAEEYVCKEIENV